MKTELDLNFKNNSLTRVEDICIPDVFFRRFKTNSPVLDEAYGGDGFLPGMVFTLAGAPGAGKTTLLLQTLELLESSQVNTGYMSGEENIYQLAFASKRLNVKKTRISNACVIEDIFEEIESQKLQIVILDSFASLQTRSGLTGIAKEKYIINYIVKEAKRLEVVIGIVLHFTKQGTYKGSTLIPHAADANLILTINKEDDSLRDLEIAKNRFGRAVVTTFSMTGAGFDFSEKRETKVDGVLLQKKSKSETAKDKILALLVSQTKVTIAEVAKALNDIGLVQRVTKDLVNAGVLKKFGRGPKTYWKKN